MLSGHMRCESSLGAELKDAPLDAESSKRFVQGESEKLRAAPAWTALECSSGGDIDQNIPNLRTGMSA